MKVRGGRVHIVGHSASEDKRYSLPTSEEVPNTGGEPIGGVNARARNPVAGVGIGARTADQLKKTSSQNKSNK
jgi:hypothetical protein